MRANVYERSRRELWGFAAAVLFFGICLNVNRATQFLAVADGDCVEQPSLEPPAWIDPNKVAGHLIDVQTVPAGKFNRVGRICDPCDWPIDVELLAAPAGFGVTVDPDAETWTIAGELPPGDWGIVARGRNRPRYGEPNEVIVTVYVRALAPVNDSPRLY